MSAPSQAQGMTPARELIRVATSQVSLGRTGTDQSIPIPVTRKKRGQGLAVMILFYVVDPRPGKERAAPPDLFATLDAVTSEVIESGVCVPQDFGVQQEADAVIEGFDLDPRLSPRDRLASRERLRDISHVVWEIYHRKVKRLTDEQLELVGDYDEHFRRIAIAPLRPFYQEVGGDFLRWVLRVSAR